MPYRVANVFSPISFIIYDLYEIYVHICLCLCGTCLCVYLCVYVYVLVCVFVYIIRIHTYAGMHTYIIYPCTHYTDASAWIKCC